MTGSRGNKVAYRRAVARHGHRTITFKKEIGKSSAKFTNANDEGFHYRGSYVYLMCT